MGVCGHFFFGPSALHPLPQTIVQHFATSCDIGCGKAAWAGMLIMAAACGHCLLKLKLTVVACIVQASHPIEQNYLIQ